MNNDLINGIYEVLGGCFLWGNVRQLHRDKQVAGVRLSTTIFFNSWGFWNLYYYSGMQQWYSLLGGLNIVCANTVWVIQMIYYRRKNGRSSTLQSPAA